MEIKLDAETVAGIASAAIFDSMSQEARDSVMKQALQFLLTPEKNRNGYGVGETPLQTAFNSAIQQAAFKVVKEKIENDLEVQNHIRHILGPLLISALDAEAEEYNSSLADALGNALGVWLANQARERRNR